MTRYQSDHAVFAACYADWRLIKGRKVVQIVLELPIEKSDQAYRVLGGMPDPGTSAWFAVAALEEDPKPQINRLTQQAGILSNNPKFWEFLGLKYIEGNPIPDRAAALLRSRCAVNSRRDILPGTPAAEKFARLKAEFELWERENEVPASA